MQSESFLPCKWRPNMWLSLFCHVTIDTAHIQITELHSLEYCTPLRCLFSPGGLDLTNLSIPPSIWLQPFKHIFKVLKLHFLNTRWFRLLTVVSSAVLFYRVSFFHQIAGFFTDYGVYAQGDICRVWGREACLIILQFWQWQVLTA